MSDVSNLRDTILPKSDQLNAEQLLGGAMTITVTDVRRGATDEQPIAIHYTGDNGRPYKPCKSMRKVLVFAWGEDGRQWIGRSMTLFNNPEVMFGGVKVGGIRISHLTDIERDIQLSLTKTRGKKEPFVIQRMASDPKVEQYRQRLRAVAEDGVDKLEDAWKKTPARIRSALGEGFFESLKQRASETQKQNGLGVSSNRQDASAITGDDPASVIVDLNQSIEMAQVEKVDGVQNADHF